MTVAELLDADSDFKPRANSNLNLSAGISTSGINLEMLRKNLVKTGDFAKLAFNMNQQQMKAYSFTFMHPFLAFPPSAIFSEDYKQKQAYELSYTYEIDTKSSKFESLEHSHFLELSSNDSPWRLKAERTIRKIKIDKDASYYFLKNESLPSLKHSATLAYLKMSKDSMTRLSTELTFPLNDERSPSYLKIEAKR